MINDVYGAWGETAKTILRQITRRLAARDGQHLGTVSIKTHRWLLSRLQRRVADILLLATPSDLREGPHEQYQ